MIDAHRKSVARGAGISSYNEQERTFLKHLQRLTCTGALNFAQEGD